MKPKTLFLAILLPLAAISLPSGCTTAPSSRISEIQTLKAVGLVAKGAIDSAAILLRDGKLTVYQYQSIANIYDTRFQPAFNLAVKAVQSDLSPASPELVQLAADLSALVATYSH